MTKRKLEHVTDLIKDRKELKNINKALGRLADPKVQPGIDYAMRRFSELAPPGIIKRELQLSGLSTNQSDIALEAAKYLLTLDENWTEEIVMAVPLIRFVVGAAESYGASALLSTPNVQIYCC